MNKPTRLGMVALATIAALASIQTATAAQPDEPGNQGTIKIHDDVDADPDMRNEPHVSCDFYVEGFFTAADEGKLTFYSWPPTGNKSVALEATWTSDPGDDDHFLEGPFNLAAGHYKLEATNIDGHTKSKVFWVDPCRPECPPTDNTFTAEGCATPVCPVNLRAVANGDASVTLSFDAAAGAEGYSIYRAVGDGEMEYLAGLDANTTTYVDTDTEAGTSYTYQVSAILDGQESADCAMVEVTAVPEFTTTAGMALAAVLGTVGYAISRRKA